MKNIGMAFVAAVALIAGSAQAQEAGWDTKYGILFTVPNPFGGGSGKDVINDYDGYVGFQYNLGPQTGLRLGANLLRKSCGDFKYTNDANVTFEGPCTDITSTSPTALPATGITVPGYSSHYLVKLAGEYMMRASTAAVSPYFGVGATINFERFGIDGTFKNSASPNTTAFKADETTFGIGALGKAGLEWRIHKVISLFAEYQIDIPLVQHESFNQEDKATGAATLSADGSRTTWFNFNTGVANSGKLGLIAFF